jgi:hypothetical protein
MKAIMPWVLISAFLSSCFPAAAASTTPTEPILIKQAARGASCPAGRITCYEWCRGRWETRDPQAPNSSGITIRLPGRPLHD